MSMALPVDAIVQPVLDQLDTGTFEIYVPDWFQDVVAGKVADPDGFQQGTTEYLRSRRACELVPRFGAFRLDRRVVLAASSGDGQ